jgi:aspartyl-tRNA(Asn)/glutamyl-tRNA(Gln) amidotransferase subunit A
MLHWSDTAVYGPITRTVRDAALYMDAVVGAHPSDPDSLPHPGYSYADMIEALPRRRRIAFNPSLGYATVQHDVMREVEAAVQVFRDLGHHVVVTHDTLPDLGIEWATVSGAEVYAEIADEIEMHRSQFGRGFLAGIERAKEISAAHMGRMYRLRAQLNQAIAELFERFDLLLTPTLPIEAFSAAGPFPTEINGQPIATPLGAVAFTYPFNFSGHPAATVRAGMTDAGLPCGLQIVAPRHREDLVLQAAYAYEQARPWNHEWPLSVTQSSEA